MTVIARGFSYRCEPVSLRGRVQYLLQTLWRHALLAVALTATPFSVYADTVRVAVASNFVNTFKLIAHQFEQHSDHVVKISSGSTGKQFAQIKNGAPFDVFFAADSQRPLLLEQQGDAVAGTSFAYAIGRLALWGKDSELLELADQALLSDDVKHLALANPRLAPYGKAAKQVLEFLKLNELLKGKLVQGENINQAFQFVASGNAELGFIAYSQLKLLDTSSYWLVPQHFYEPIEQHAVLISDSSAARELLEFMGSEQALVIIRQQGYDTP